MIKSFFTPGKLTFFQQYIMYINTYRPELHDAGFALEWHQIKKLYSLICSWNFPFLLFLIILLYCYNFNCKIHFEIAKFNVAPMVIRYRVTWVTIHWDYKRIESSSQEELRDKLNKSNGGGGIRSLMKADQNTLIHLFCSFFVCFMSSVCTDIHYNGNILE